MMQLQLRFKGFYNKDIFVGDYVVLTQEALPEYTTRGNRDEIGYCIVADRWHSSSTGKDYLLIENVSNGYKWAANLPMSRVVKVDYKDYAAWEL